MILALSCAGCGSSTPQPLEPAPASPPAAEVQVPAAPPVASSAPEPQVAQPPPTVAPPPLPSPTTEAPPVSSSPAKVTAKPEYQGTIGARSGKSLTLQISGVAANAAGAKAELFRRFGQNLGALSVTGWLDVAEVIVRKVDAGQVVVEVVKEKSDIRVNGKRVDHFGPGETIKLELR